MGGNVQFNISFDVANSPDLGSLTASEQQAVLDAANMAAAIWARYLTAANVTLDLQIIVDNSQFSGNVLATGGPEIFVSTGNTFDGKTVYEALPAVKLRTGADANGATSDMGIGLTVNSIRNMMAFKTDEYGAVPGNRVDAISVFLHEIGHGLGFLYAGDDLPGIGVFDTFVHGLNFQGPNASIVALDPSSPSHISESGPNWSDLMSPIASSGANIHISQLDLSILQDMGVPVRIATAGNDILWALDNTTLNMGDGDDTGYALPNGSYIIGGAGNDRFIGNIRDDRFEGGDGDDLFEGGGGDDEINGGAGYDTARYSGLVSDYRLTWLGPNAFQIQDLRGGRPDGIDRLTDIERLQWGDGSYITPTSAPIVTAENYIAGTRKLPVSTLFSATDSNNDRITAYQFRDTTSDPDSGYFVVNGVAQAAGSIIQITDGQLSSTYFVTGKVSDTLEVRAYDGTLWSAPDNGPWTKFTITPPVNHAPVLQTYTASPNANGILSFAEMFRVSDAEGDAVTKYQVLDTTTAATSGHLEIDGVPQSAGTVLEVTAAQMGSMRYIAGTTGDVIRMRAFDGIDWSANDDGPWSTIHLLTYSDTLPRVLARSSSGPRGTPVPVASLFYAYSMPDGRFDTITKYQFLDTNTAAGSGYFTVGGVVQAAGTPFEVNTAQLSQVSFVAGDDYDDLQVRVYDGTNWSADGDTPWTPFVFQRANRAPVISESPINVTAMPGQSVSIAALAAATTDADGDAVTYYRIRKTSTASNGGHLFVNGVIQPDNALVSVPAANLSQVIYVAGSASETLEISAYDGIDWGGLPYTELLQLKISVSLLGASTEGPIGLPGTNGKGDILWQHDGGQVVLWRMSGNVVQASSALTNTTADWTPRERADFNGDGKADILWQNADGRGAIWMMNGDTMIAGSGSLDISAGSWRTRAAGDFNGDGKADIAWQNGAGQTVIWLMNGTSLVGNSGVLDTSAGAWQVKASGDFNADGKADLLWQSDTGQAAIWLMNGTTTLAGSGALATTGSDWKVKETGDFNGDGKADILWQNDNGQAAIWLMNGTSLLDGSGALPTTGPEWQVKSTGDYNSDGKSDIGWQNSNGQAAVWVMNGRSVIDGGVLPATGTAWHMVT